MAIMLVKWLFPKIFEKHQNKNAQHKEVVAEVKMAVLETTKELHLHVTLLDDPVHEQGTWDKTLELKDEDQFEVLFFQT